MARRTTMVALMILAFGGCVHPVDRMAVARADLDRVDRQMRELRLSFVHRRTPTWRMAQMWCTRLGAWLRVLERYRKWPHPWIRSFVNDLLDQMSVPLYNGKEAVVPVCRGRKKVLTKGGR